MKTFANARGMIVDEVIKDIGNGLNYKRKQWNKLIDSCMERNTSTIIIAHKDRFVRFGYDWFEKFLRKMGVEIMIVNNEKHVFSCRIYGLRKYKKKMSEDEDL